MVINVPEPFAFYDPETGEIILVEASYPEIEVLRNILEPVILTETKPNKEQQTHANET